MMSLDASSGAMASVVGGGSEVRKDRLCVGCVVLLTTSDEYKYEGKVHALEPVSGQISLYQVTCITNERKHDGLMQFFREDIIGLEVVKEGRRPASNSINGSKSTRPADSTSVGNLSSGSSHSGAVKRTAESGDKGADTRLSSKPSHNQGGEVEIGTTLDDENAEDQRTLSDTSAQYVLLEELDETFHIAISGIERSAVIGVAMEGVNIGRAGELHWVQISINGFILLFDMVRLGDAAFKEGLKAVFEDTTIQKVIHDCRSIADLLYHKYNTNLVNVFDTQVADIRVHMLNNKGEMPRGTSSLVVCLTEHLNLPLDRLCTYQIRNKKVRETEGKVWCERPMSREMIELGVMNVVYLRDLRTRLMEKMLAELIDGCDVYLSLHRDASDETLPRLQNQLHTVPDEFRNLAWYAKESRRRTRRLRLNRSKPDGSEDVKPDSTGDTADSERPVIASSNEAHRSDSDSRKPSSGGVKQFNGGGKQSSGDREAGTQTKKFSDFNAPLTSKPSGNSAASSEQKFEESNGSSVGRSDFSSVGVVVAAGHEHTWLSGQDTRKRSGTCQMSTSNDKSRGNGQSGGNIPLDSSCDSGACSSSSEADLKTAGHASSQCPPSHSQLSVSLAEGLTNQSDRNFSGGGASGRGSVAYGRSALELARGSEVLVGIGRGSLRMVGGCDPLPVVGGPTNHLSGYRDFLSPIGGSGANQMSGNTEILSTNQMSRFNQMCDNPYSSSSIAESATIQSPDGSGGRAAVVANGSVPLSGAGGSSTRGMGRGRALVALVEKHNML